MSLFRRALPHPALSVFLLFIWLLLNNTLAPGHVVLGAGIGIGMPLLTARFWPETAGVRRWQYVPGYILLVLYDIVVANLAVARTTLSMQLELRPGYIRLPLDLTDGFAITVLASTISLTPGTVSVDVSPEQDALLVHCLDLDDPDALVAEIKQRYERRLKEIFTC